MHISHLADDEVSLQYIVFIDYIELYNEASENIVVESISWINVFCYNCSSFISSLLMIS